MRPPRGRCSWLGVGRWPGPAPRACARAGWGGGGGCARVCTGARRGGECVCAAGTQPGVLCRAQGRPSSAPPPLKLKPPATPPNTPPPHHAHYDLVRVNLSSSLSLTRPRVAVDSERAWPWPWPGRGGEGVGPLCGHAGPPGPLLSRSRSDTLRPLRPREWLPLLPSAPGTSRKNALRRSSSCGVGGVGWGGAHADVDEGGSGAREGVQHAGRRAHTSAVYASPPAAGRRRLWHTHRVPHAREAAGVADEHGRQAVGDGAAQDAAPPRPAAQRRLQPATQRGLRAQHRASPSSESSHAQRTQRPPCSTAAASSQPPSEACARSIIDRASSPSSPSESSARTARTAAASSHQSSEACTRSTQPHCMDCPLPRLGSWAQPTTMQHIAVAIYLRERCRQRCAAW